MKGHAEYFPPTINRRVSGMEYHSDVGNDGIAIIDLGAPVPLDADGILSAQSIAAAGSATSFASTYSVDSMARYGRNVTAVASGVATSTVTVTGRDYLGQPMKEELTLNGTTAVNGKKAFYSIEKVEWGATAATTINVGWGNVLGLPFKMISPLKEFVNDAVPHTGGTFAVGVLTQTLTSADPRGTYAPHSDNPPNGWRVFSVHAFCDREELHGVAHFFS